MGRKTHEVAAGVALLLLTMMTGCSAAIAGTARPAPATSVTSSPGGGGGSKADDVTGTVIDEANVRTGPGMDYDILTSLASGAQVTVSCASGEWQRLAAPHPGGYVFHSLLKLQGTPKRC